MRLPNEAAKTEVSRLRLPASCFSNCWSYVQGRQLTNMNCPKKVAFRGTSRKIKNCQNCHVPVYYSGRQHSDNPERSAKHPRFRVSFPTECGNLRQRIFGTLHRKASGFHDMQKLFSPRLFAQAIGVSESSVRRWADSGQIKMTRTAGGHRKIARAEAIRFIRQTSASVVRPDLLQISEPRHRRHRVEAFAAQHEQLFKALKQGDADVVSGLLTTMYVNGVSASEICDGPVRHAMERIGKMWPHEQKAILTEHRATNICIESMTRLRTNFTRSADGGPIAVGGAPENDPYVLPSLMATTVLADVGFQPINLGPNTPLDVLAQFALDADARLIWIALTAPLPRATVEKALLNLTRHVRRKRLQVVIGGRATHRFAIPQGDRTHTFASMSEMAGFAKGLLAKLKAPKPKSRASTKVSLRARRKETK